MKILFHKQIKQIVSIPAVLQAIEEGFIIYSRGETVNRPSSLSRYNSSFTKSRSSNDK
jgi:hypothetical protein